jgi:hypothetical protein
LNNLLVLHPAEINQPTPSVAGLASAEGGA